MLISMNNAAILLSHPHDTRANDKQTIFFKETQVIALDKWGQFLSVGEILSNLQIFLDSYNLN